MKTVTEKFSNIVDLNFLISSENFLFNLTIFFIFIVIISAGLRILFGYFQAKVVNGFFYDLNFLFYNSVLKKKYKDLADYNPN